MIIVIALAFLSGLSLSGGGYKQYTNRLFALFSLIVAIWIPANHISNSFDVPGSLVILANYAVFPSAFGAMALLMLFIIELANFKRIKRRLKLLIPPLVIICLLSPTPFLVEGIEKQGNVYAILFGPFISIYALALFVMIGVTAYSLTFGLRHLTGMHKRRLQVVSTCLMIALPLIVLFLFIIPSLTGLFAFTAFGISPLLILVVGIYYSAVKHHLFDIRLAAVRTVAYLSSLLVLAAVYYLLAYVVSVTLFKGEVNSAVSISPINILLALILAFVFQPVKTFFDKTTDNIFYRDRYNSEEFYARLSEVLTTTTDLRNLLERASNEVGATLKAEQAFFFVQYNHVHHVTAGTRGHTALPLADAHRLNEYVKKEGHDIIVTELLPEDHTIHRMLISHRVAILMPIMRGSSILGYLALGEQRSSGYTNRDIKVLKTISDELVIAIQNALSVQEVKDINVHLQQRINAATAELRSSNTQLRHLDKTKDEFLSMASHQLRTPLTSVKGYLSMVLEGDAGKVSESQKQLLGEAFASSERMVHLIHDFLNVSRLQTGKFMLELHPFDLVKLVAEEVKSLERTAETRNMRLEFTKNIDSLMLTIDENKIRQVVMNFIDNALFYSHDDSVITIDLKQVGDQVEVRVIDTGIGVPKGEQSQLFSKFYRASNARKQRPDGTGVGIFLAKKVITEHGGTVIFTSEEGKGSTFGFTLPIKKLAVDSDE